MTRRSFLPKARPTLLLVLLAMAAPIPAARSQDRAPQDRLDRLERDLTMLQRQVYRGGGAPAGADNNIAVDSQIRMDRLEAQMRELTGRVEDETNEVQQLRQRLEQINSDLDVRFSQGQGDAQGTGAPPALHPRAGDAIAPRSPPPRASSASLTSYGSGMPPGSLVPPPPDTPTSSGTLTPPGTPLGTPPGTPPRTPPGTPPGPTQLTPRPANVAAGGDLRPPGVGGLPTGSASDQYNSAFGLLKQADYPAAETALRTFVQQHPDDRLAGNAQYWLGESYYARGKYPEAAGAFAEGYKRYPKGAKAADDLLKLGMSLARANQKQNACVSLVQLDHDFPHAGSAVKERAAAEKKRLGC